jgi:hypothetical protein
LDATSFFFQDYYYYCQNRSGFLALETPLGFMKPQFFKSTTSKWALINKEIGFVGNNWKLTIDAKEAKTNS